MRRVITLVFALGLAISLAAPAGAITTGEPDHGEHPYVGELLFYVPDATDSRFNDPGAWFTCTGTLIAEMVVLTAGHCTYAVGLNSASTIEGNGDGNGGNDVWISFAEEPDFDILDPSLSFGADGNAARYTQWSTALNGSGEWHRGTATSHPDYSDPAFFLADAGILELATEPGIGEVATLAPIGHLDQYLGPRDPDKRFTAVGYGLETGFPTFLGGDTRMKAEMKLVSLNGAYGAGKGTAAAFSSNPSQGKGGTCFGDSGGPVFDGDLLVAVTSFGISFNCVEPGGYYRIDQPDDADFIADFLG